METLLLVVLATALTITHSVEVNSRPCMATKYNNAHKIFLKRHLPEGAPTTMDHNAWETFFRETHLCGRPTQSFLRYSEKQKVDKVCSRSGGKNFNGNLCISNDIFSFVTVRISEGTCGIRSVHNETKHIILACDEIEDVCQPVHFEGNPKNLTPHNNQPYCGYNTGFKILPAGVVLFTLTLLAVICNL